MSTGPTAGGNALLRLPTPEEVELPSLRRQAEEAKDQIAAQELRNETLRRELAQFELTCQDRLSYEQGLLSRAEAVVRHLMRQAALLRERPSPAVALKARAAARRWAREVKAQQQDPHERRLSRSGKGSRKLPAPPPPAQDELKSLYRALARQFHPDLARTEADRVRFGERMTRINGLYHARDLEGLKRLVRLHPARDDAGAHGTPAELLRALRQELAWLHAVLANLQEEHAALVGCPTHALLQRSLAAAAAGGDLLEELRSELEAQIDEGYTSVRTAAHFLEAQVTGHNRRASELMKVDREASELAPLFDPHTPKRLVRLGLESLASRGASAEAKRLAGWLEDAATAQPEVLRLILLAHVAELAPQPLPGLERYEDVAERLSALEEDAASGTAPRILEKALVAAADKVELGLRSAGKGARATLRLRDPQLRAAVPLGLRRPLVREEFRRVLQVLGKRAPCAVCTAQVFELPLYRLKGIDDLHATACPRCGAFLSSYFLPAGHDVQSVLNPAFLELEILFEVTFHLARASVAMQFAPAQWERLSAGELKARFHAEVLARHKLPVRLEQLRLLQHRREVPPATPVSELEPPTLTVTFARGAKLSPQDALEVIRHRIRTRFRPEQTDELKVPTRRQKARPGGRGRP